MSNLENYNETIGKIADEVAKLTGGKVNEDSASVRDTLAALKDYVPEMTYDDKIDLLNYLGLSKFSSHWLDLISAERITSLKFIREVAKKSFENDLKLACENHINVNDVAYQAFQEAKLLNDARIEFEKNFK